MTKSKCPNCSYEISKEWNFCPRCGLELPKWYDKLNYGLDRMLMKVAEDIKNLFFNSMIEITLNGMPLQPEYSHKHAVNNKKRNDMPKWDIKDVKEPAVKYIEAGNKTIVEIITPPIKKESDVHLTVNKESVEVRVYHSEKKTLYFKLLAIPSDIKMISKKIENHQLKIIFLKGERNNAY